MKKDMEVVKIVIFTPESHADAVRAALVSAGAGKVGDYSHSSFSVKGTGRFKPLEGARPYVGAIGCLEEVGEERIETVCYYKDLRKIIAAVKKVHPYEEVAIDVYPLVLNPDVTTYNRKKKR